MRNVGDKKTFPWDQFQFYASEESAGMSNADLDGVSFLKRLRREMSAEESAWVATQLKLRRHALEKFPTASRMCFTPVGFQQSTDVWVATYKASRFPDDVPCLDLCCGVGGDLLALAQRHSGVIANENIQDLDEGVPYRVKISGTFPGKSAEDFICIKKSISGNPSSVMVRGVDSNPETACIAQWNLSVHGLENVAEVCCEDVCLYADSVFRTAYPAVHIDPDRRSAGYRGTHPEFHHPPLDVVETLITGRMVACVKLAPGSSIPEGWEKRAELEWIDRDRQCRQLVAWFASDEYLRKFPGSFSPGQRRATILDARTGIILKSFMGPEFMDSEAYVSVFPIGTYIYDPDAAVLAAHLDVFLARSLGLKRIQENVAYYTSDNFHADAGMSCFSVIQCIPLDRKKLQALMDKYEVGILEIKKRGETPTPESVRKWLKLRGTRSFTLFMMRGGGNAPAVCVLAQRSSLS